ncbi:hypothetical protein [Chryseobacterium sp. JK1]|uniref:hypothetical protein n=1 Tax=Chryseobacterium sp. JK1 TaxID=874294 RepID=UPI003D68D622
MATYMTQTMQSGKNPKINYYRKSSAHPSHDETGKFTQDAINNYSKKYQVPANTIEKGRFQSGQGVPTGPNTQEI